MKKFNGTEIIPHTVTATITITITRPLLYSLYAPATTITLLFPSEPIFNACLAL